LKYDLNLIYNLLSVNIYIYVETNYRMIYILTHTWKLKVTKCLLNSRDWVTIIPFICNSVKLSVQTFDILVIKKEI